MQLLDCLASRRTIHQFRPDPVPRDVLDRALEMACWAPNHRLTEPWRFHVLGAQTAAALVELNTRIIAEHARPEFVEQKRLAFAAVPQWVVVASEIDENPAIAREDYAACACAVHNLSLALWAEGIGCKWTTGPVTLRPEFYDLVWLDPKTQVVVGLLMLGYPTQVPKASRKPWREMTVELP